MTVVVAGWTKPTTGCITSNWIFLVIVTPVPPIEPVDVATSELCAVNVNVSSVAFPIAV